MKMGDQQCESNSSYSECDSEISDGGSESTEPMEEEDSEIEESGSDTKRRRTDTNQTGEQTKDSSANESPIDINRVFKGNRPIISDLDGAKVETYFDLDPDSNPADILDRVNEMRTVKVGTPHPDDLEEDKRVDAMKKKAIEDGIDLSRFCPVCFVSEVTDQQREVMNGIWSVIDDLALRKDDRILCESATSKYNKRVYEASIKLGERCLPKWSTYEVYMHVNYCDKLAPVRRYARQQEFLMKIMDHLRGNIFEKVTIGNTTMDERTVNIKNAELYSKLLKNYSEGQKNMLSMIAIPNNNSQIRGTVTQNEQHNGSTKKANRSYIGQKMPAFQNK